MLYIAENLRLLRKEKDFTQEEVAEVLSVSPQSVSKWERGDTMPDITLLPVLANLYKVSVDTLIGMDKINDRQAKKTVFDEGYAHLRTNNISAAIDVFAKALNTFPFDEGYMAYLAITLALDGDADKMAKSIDLCKQVLAKGQSVKTCHTTRAALCFIYMKAGEKEKAVETAQMLPHLRESRENVLEQLERKPTEDDINAYLKFIAIGDSDEQDVIEIDFGEKMVILCEKYDLLGKIKVLREELGAPTTTEGLRILSHIRIRDNIELAPTRVRARNCADYLLDKEFTDPALAVTEIIAVLRKIAQAKFKIMKHVDET